ncbi:MAG: hypothetical protein PHO02_07235 [Candidatus Nanoarchaeia archaeon]|nr:hypothetical protein [Candidatus Nanoarchaeia archaeon]
MTLDDLDKYVQKEEEARKLLEEVEQNARDIDSRATGRTQRTLTERITAIETEATQQILRVAGTIDSTINNVVLNTKLKMDCPYQDCKCKYGTKGYTADVEVKDGMLELDIFHQRYFGNNNNNYRSYEEKLLIKINTQNQKIKVSYGVTDIYPVYRLSRLKRSPAKAFRILAKDYQKEKNQPFIEDFISTYVSVPEILAKAVIQIKQEQTAKETAMGILAKRLGAFGTEEESTGLLEETAGSSEESKTPAPEGEHMKVRDTRASTIFEMQKELLEKMIESKSTSGEKK